MRRRPPAALAAAAAAALAGLPAPASPLAFRPGATVLYQDRFPSGTGSGAAIWGVDLASSPCCKATLVRQFSDSEYGFGDAVPVAAIATTESIAVLGDPAQTATRAVAVALRSSDGWNATVGVSDSGPSGIGQSPRYAGALGLRPDGRVVAIWIDQGQQVSDESLCYGPVNVATGVFDKEICQAWPGRNLYSCGGHVTTSWWDAGRGRLVMIVSNCGTVGGCGSPLVQHVVWADVTGASLKQRALGNAVSGDGTACWHPRKCDVAPNGTYVCLVYCAGASGYASLDPATWAWGPVMTSPLWSFAVVDGFGVGADTGNLVWAFDATKAASPGARLTMLGTLHGTGIGPSGAGRMWSFASRGPAAGNGTIIVRNYTVTVPARAPPPRR